MLPLHSVVVVVVVAVVGEPDGVDGAAAAASAFPGPGKLALGASEVVAFEKFSLLSSFILTIILFDALFVLG